MPRAGFVSGAGSRWEGSAGQGFAPGGNDPDWPVGSASPRLSQATTASTRGSHCPMYETPAAPYEWPASPRRFGLTILASGLYAVSRPAPTRRSCLGPWLVPVSQLGTGSYGLLARDRKKLIASSVPSKNGRPSLCEGTPSNRSSPSPKMSDWP